MIVFHVIDSLDVESAADQLNGSNSSEKYWLSLCDTTTQTLPKEFFKPFPSLMKALRIELLEDEYILINIGGDE